MFQLLNLLQLTFSELVSNSSLVNLELKADLPLGLKVVWWLITNDKGEDKSKKKVKLPGEEKLKLKVSLNLLKLEVKLVVKLDQKIKLKVKLTLIKLKIKLE